MDDLPLELQSCIYIDAGVNGVCTTCRDAVYSATLLANRHSAEEPFQDTLESQLPQPTWRVCAMAQPADRSPLKHIAALRRIGERFATLRHVSLLVVPSNDWYPPTDRDRAGLYDFLRHAVPALSAPPTMLTVRGGFSTRSQLTPQLPWHDLSLSQLGQCHRLDVSSDADTIAYLLNSLDSLFPLVSDVRVHTTEGPIRHSRPAHLHQHLSLGAPASLTRLRLLLHVAPGESRQTELRLRRAPQLQELWCRYQMSADGQPSPHDDGSSHTCHVYFDEAPALQSVRGSCFVYLQRVQCADYLPALRHVDTTLDQSTPFGLALSVLFSWRMMAPALLSLHLNTGGSRLTQEEAARLVHRAADRLRLRLTVDVPF